MDLKRSPSLPIALGLGVLLIVVIDVVVESHLHLAQTSQEIENKLMSHSTASYYFKAEVMARQLVSAPSARWSHYVLDPDTYCFQIGHGVWYAAGTVDRVTNDGTRFQSAWQVYFIPESEKPIFIKIGDQEWGNYNEAAKLAAAPMPAD